MTPPVDRSVLLAAVDRIPPLPALVVELLRSLDNENTNAAALAQRIGRDPPLSARVLRVVNSPFYGLMGQVSSLSEAVMVLGFSNIRSLSLAACLVSNFDTTKKILCGFAHRQLWEHSIACALCCRLLAPRARINPQTAFTTGLLHDIGRIAMLTLQPELFEQVTLLAAKENIDHVESETRVFGFDHADLGATMLERWRLPNSIVGAVRQHHTEDPAEPITELLRAECFLSPAFTDGILHAEDLPQTVCPSLLRLGISRAECVDTLQPLGEQLQAISAIFAEAEMEPHDLARVRQ